MPAKKKKATGEAVPSPYKPPSRAEMLRMDAERLARDAILDSPAMKRLLQQKTSAIIKAASPKTGPAKAFKPGLGANMRRARSF